MSNRKRKAKIPPPRDIELRPAAHQPSRAELREEHDMPGMTDEQIRDTFFRPFRVTEKRD